MYKKIILITLSFFLFGCTSNINQMTLQEIIDESIQEEKTFVNINNKGYKYHLPSEFTVSEDNDYIQKLTSKNRVYYMNVDIVSYYYKNKLEAKHNLDDYEYYTFSNNNKQGYLRITKNNENFVVELCYNYAIIEVEVEESELRYAISRGILILDSIKYNDLVIEKYIVDKDIENSETIFKIPEPSDKDNHKNVLEYVEEFDPTEGSED